MKIYAAAFVLIGLLAVTSCATESSNQESSITTVPAEKQKIYPAAMQSIFDVHGGLTDWSAYRTLAYSMGETTDAERQWVDLYDRRELIKQPAKDVTIGYDGTKSWVLADTSYKGDPLFYRNLIFYFYAMPWVLADEGIIYEDTAPLTYEGVEYPGVKISYNEGVGLSPKDNYFIHTDPATGKMRWLGYTVTYRSGEVSDRRSYIEYPTWSDRGGVELPDSLVWYKVEEGQLVEPRNTRIFTKVELTKDELPAAHWAIPAGKESMAKLFGE